MEYPDDDGEKEIYPGNLIKYYPEPGPGPDTRHEDNGEHMRAGLCFTPSLCRHVSLCGAQQDIIKQSLLKNIPARFHHKNG